MRKLLSLCALSGVMLGACSDGVATVPGPATTTSTATYSGPELHLEAELVDGFWCTRVVDDEETEYLQHSCFDVRDGFGVGAGGIRLQRSVTVGDLVVHVFVRGEGVNIVNGGGARVQSDDPHGFVVWHKLGPPPEGTFWTEFEGTELECWVVKIDIKCIDR